MAQERDEDRLKGYRDKRDFAKTSEPGGDPSSRPPTRHRSLSFVVQKHAATRLHYDFRLELDGVLVSWAVPKGPSLDPADKRMAVHVEDHPLSYGKFEGTIPPKQYGAGSVIVWDRGHWAPVGDPHEGLKQGKLAFVLHGDKLGGLWELVKIAKGGERQEPWLLFKKRDGYARPRAEFDVVQALPDSVLDRPRTPEAAAAVNAALPEKLPPQLATLASRVPTAGDWRFEIKFDGYRVMARIDRGEVRLITRNGHDWSAKMPRLVRELAGWGLASAWLDGEVVVIGAEGAPDFGALQKAFDRRGDTDALSYFLFDIPFHDGRDLRGLPLTERRAVLKSLLDAKGSEHVRYSADFEADPATLLASACRMKLEGVIAKRADAPYASGRSESWLKLKCQQRQEFVVCGYTERSDDAAQVGSLLLGVQDEAGKLVSVGSVGTGWDADEARRLKARLARLAADQPPFEAAAPKAGRWSRRAEGSERWVKPRLVAEVAFAAWTGDQQIRHARYVALRQDKPPKAIVREAAVAADGLAPVKRAGQSAPSRLAVTHGERVIDPQSGLTKLDLVRYYESIAPWMWPHLKQRPCSLVRGPAGVGGQLFFQKHGEKLGIPGVEELDAALWPDHAPLLAIGRAEALAAAAQMNVIEFHTWNSTTAHIDKPDRMVFDLDPGEGTAWPQVQEAATLTRSLLTELGLESWLKTSGGKGLHLVVPIAARWPFDTVKAFSQAIVQHLASVLPSRFVAKSGPSNRVGKVFADYLRNGHGATTAAAFSVRARPGLGVSMPVAWDALAGLKSGAHWHLANAREHLSFQKVDPWADYWTQRQSLTAPMKALSFKPPPRAARKHR